jgi:hypothetical protein
MLVAKRSLVTETCGTCQRLNSDFDELQMKYYGKYTE